MSENVGTFWIHCYHFVSHINDTVAEISGNHHCGRLQIFNISEKDFTFHLKKVNGIIGKNGTTLVLFTITNLFLV